MVADLKTLRPYKIYLRYLPNLLHRLSPSQKDLWTYICMINALTEIFELKNSASSEIF